MRTNHQKNENRTNAPWETLSLNCEIDMRAGLHFGPSVPRSRMHFFSRTAFAAVAALLLAGASAWSQTVDDFVKKGEVYDLKFEANEALKYYMAAHKLDPKNPTVLCRIARQYRHLMADASEDAEKVRLGKIALDSAHNAATIAPDLAEAQLSVAITYGKLLPYLGKKEQVQASPRIKTAVDRSLALDPSNDLAWHILGRWHRTLAEIGGVKRAFAGAIYGSLPKGSSAEAEKCLSKAIALNPNRLMHYIELGRVYAQMGKKDDARRMINKGLVMPNTDKDDPDMKQKGRETLAGL